MEAYFYGFLPHGIEYCNKKAIGSEESRNQHFFTGWENNHSQLIHFTLPFAMFLTKRDVAVIITSRARHKIGESSEPYASQGALILLFHHDIEDKIFQNAR